MPTPEKSPQSPSGPAQVLSLGDATAIIVGLIVGAGIFGTPSIVAGAVESPVLVVAAWVAGGVFSLIGALCYAELASTIPVSGSSYSYAYATLGELVAYIVGACLLLEYAVSCSAIAVGWGQYLNQLLGNVSGWQMPAAISQPPHAGGYVNLPAIVLVVMCMALLIRGGRESTQ